MGVGTTLARVFTSVVGKAAPPVEGSVRGGPWNLPASGVTWSTGAPSYGGWWNGWQMGGEPWTPSGQMAVARACRQLYASTISSCPIAHYIRVSSGAKVRVDSSDAARLFLSPNDEMTWEDFISELVLAMLTDGNGYAICRRNHRFEVDEFQLLDPRLSFPQITPEGVLGYAIGGNPIVDANPELYGDPDISALGWRYLWPARDILHLKLPSYGTARRPAFFIGESPLEQAFGADELVRRLTALLDSKHPRAVALLEQNANREQVEQLREALKAGFDNNGISIMTNGAKLQPWSGGAMLPRDIQLLEFLTFDREEVLSVYHVPPQLLGLGHAASTGTMADLMVQWRMTGLNPLVGAIEAKLGKFLKLKGYPHEWIEMDLDEALSRADMRTRIEMTAREIQVGAISIDEARRREDRPPVDGGWGQMPRTQAQNVPLSVVGTMPTAPSAPAPAAGSDPAPDSSLERPSVRALASLTADEEADEIERLMMQEETRRRRASR